jgi:hypothetical protein
LRRLRFGSAGIFGLRPWVESIPLQIQELAGYQDLPTMQRYMHLSPAALDAAIRLLETGTETVDLAVEK